MPSKPKSISSSAKRATTSKSTTRQMELFAPSPQPYKPHQYQKRGVRFLLENAAAGLFLDPGLGKTSIVLAAIMILKAKKLIDKALVVAPLRVTHSVWPGEITKWLDFAGLTYVVLHGPKKDELLQEDVDLYLINPEGLDWLLQPTKVKRGKKTIVSVNTRRFRSLGFDLLVLDELTKFKNPSSTRFKIMKKVLGAFKRRWGLTGSLGASGLEDLFGQMYMLDEGASLGSYVTHYRKRYFSPGFDGFSYDLLPGAEQEIYRAIAPLSLRMAAEDYLKLPALIENVIPTPLPDDVMEIYQQLEGELVTKIGSGLITAKTIGVALGKCRQLTGGAIYAQAGLGELLKPSTRAKRDWHRVHDVKLDALEELVEELQGSPMLIAYEFHHELERIKERFGDLPYIGEGVSAKRGKEIEAAWNRGEIPLLPAHPASIAHGLNLQESGQHITWLTPTWDYELYDQYIRRLLRQGSAHKRIFSHLLIAPGTVDELVLKALRTKKRGQDELYAGIKALQSKVAASLTKKDENILKKAIYKSRGRA